MKRSLIAVLVLLTIAACGQGSTTTTPLPSTPGAAASSTGTPIHVRDFALDPNTIVAKGAVALLVTNDGPTIHDVTIRDAAGKILGETRDLKAGESETLSVNIPAGQYTLFCSLPGHESLGVKGTLTVQN